MRRAELLGQRLLVSPSCDRDGPETHLRGKLNGQVPESANAQNGDDIPRRRGAVTERVERRDAGAHQWSGFHG